MPNPTMNTVHIDRPLSNVAIAYWQSTDEFIATKVFPIVRVDNKSDEYYTLPKGEWFRDTAELRAPSTESAGGGFTLADGSYSCKNLAYHKDLDRDVARNADIELERPVTEFVMRKILLSLEKRFMDSFLTAGVWGTDIAGVAAGPAPATQILQWDQATSTPATDIDRWKTYMKSQTGFKPNALLLANNVYDILRNHPDVLDRVKYTGNGGFVNANQLKQYFEIENIYVAGAVLNSAAEGAADSLDFMGSKEMLLTYTPGTPGMFTPTAGTTFNWTEKTGNMMVAMEKFDLKNIKSTRYEANSWFDQKLIGADLGVYFSAVIA